MSTARAELPARRQPGHSLGAPFDMREDVFGAEMKMIFARGYIFVGREPDVTAPGVGSAPLLIVRDDDGDIRASHDVCRHRGTHLVAVWKATNRQDAALVEMTQVGVPNPAHESGPYPPHAEGSVQQSCSWYVGRMQVGLSA